VRCAHVERDRGTSWSTSSFAKSRDRGTNGDDGFVSLRRVRPPRSCIRSLVSVLWGHPIGDYRQSGGPSVGSVACGARVRDRGRSCRGRRVQSARARRAAGRAHCARGHVALRHLWRATTNGRGCRRAFAERAYSAQTASGDPSRRRLRDGYRVWRTPAAEWGSTEASAEEVGRVRPTATFGSAFAPEERWCWVRAVFTA
jgi:hypothetical protein